MGGPYSQDSYSKQDAGPGVRGWVDERRAGRGSPQGASRKGQFAGSATQRKEAGTLCTFRYGFGAPAQGLILFGMCGSALGNRSSRAYAPEHKERGTDNIVTFLSFSSPAFSRPDSSHLCASGAEPTCSIGNSELARLSVIYPKEKTYGSLRAALAFLIERLKMELQRG